MAADTHTTTRTETRSSKSAKILYRPWGLISSLLAGLVAGSIFKTVWKHATPGDNQDAPKALESEYSLREVLIASALFGFYVANFSSYNKTYGALAGVIVFLLWLWLTNIALLFGAELDAELERGRQLQAGIAAEETVQLPVKDDKNIKKTEKKHDKVVAQAKALRESRGDSQDPEKG